MRPAGDVNGDSFNDLLITSNQDATTTTATTLWYGPLEMTGASISAAEADATWAGPRYGIAAAGNVNGDEYDDIWVGGPEVYLFHGSP